MTRAARRDVFSVSYFVFRYQGRTQGNLIGVTLAVHFDGIRSGRGLIAHIENLIARAQIFLRGAMAAEAPLHLQSFLLVHQRHLIHGTVASIAANSFINVNTVVEVDEVRKLVDAGPL